MGLELDVMKPEETESVRALFNNVVCEGNTYPQDVPLTPEEFAQYWLKGEAFVVRLCQENQPSTVASPASQTVTPATQMVAAFYLKPNFPGRCSHICNAGFIVAPPFRGQGIGRMMGETLIEVARDRGYRAVMYNLVFETNVPSLKIWESMGFETLGRIPQAVRLSADCYVDAIMLYKPLG